MNVIEIRGPQGSGKSKMAYVFHQARFKEFGPGALIIDADIVNVYPLSGKDFHTVVVDGVTEKQTTSDFQRVTARLRPGGVLVLVRQS